jgi:hypothetical protein
MERHVPEPERSDPTGLERTLDHAFALWITPEIERRKTAGLIGDTFTLSQAQILFGDEGPRMVRLNEEVKGLLLVQTSRAVKAGEPVQAGEIAELKGMELSEGDRDFGHFTIFRRGGGWALLFNFNRNRKYAADLITLAEEYTDAAEVCWSKALRRPFADNLFSACEILAKARLITVYLKKEARTHGYIASGINIQRRFGNVGDEFVDLFNQLTNIRPKARYSPGPAPELNDVSAALKIVRDEIQLLRESYSPKWAAEAQEKIAR